MCGIAGIIRPDGLAPSDHAGAARLGALLHHRGPDSAGTFTSPTCTLIQTRLTLIGDAILPQPYRSRDGRYVIVYNGEVYNFEELSRQLQNETQLDTGTDTEVVLASWIRWGPNALQRLNGMFAFFIWDIMEQRGFAAVDPLGIKPFFFSGACDRFVFASEAGALIESGLVPFRPDGEAIAEFLAAPYFSGATRLAFANIERLLPGHSIELTRDRIKVSEYFRFRHTRGAIRDVEALVEETAGRVEDAVVASLRADVPVGVFLSGGVDSSLLAAIAQRHASAPVPVWTIEYEGQESVDYSRSLIVKSADRPYAERVASTHGCELHVVHVDDTAYEQALLHTLRNNDLISAWEQEVSQYLLAEAASKHVKAVLVGDAADETHFGYSFLLNPDRIASPSRIIDFFGAVPTLHNDFSSRYQRHAESLGYSWETEPEQRLAMSCLILNLWLPRLLHNGDIHLMAHSLEGRVPFGDTRLLALAQCVPQELGYRDGIEKWHLRRAAERLLQPEIAWRPKSALTKNVRAAKIIYRQFCRGWKKFGEGIAPYIDMGFVGDLSNAGTPRNEVETGLCFRLLALMTWFGRLSGESL